MRESAIEQRLNSTKPPPFGATGPPVGRGLNHVRDQELGALADAGQHGFFGMVRDDRGRPSADALVVAFAADLTLWYATPGLSRLLI